MSWLMEWICVLCLFFGSYISYYGKQIEKDSIHISGNILLVIGIFFDFGIFSEFLISEQIALLIL